MTKDTGGPAFPIFPETGGGHAAAHQGLTLRDYFAAKAMQETVLMSHEELQEFTGDYEESTTLRLVAVAAYEMADAMLEARK